MRSARRFGLAAALMPVLLMAPAFAAAADGDASLGKGLVSLAAPFAAPTLAPAVSGLAGAKEESISHKGLGADVPVPAWAVGNSAIHFLPTLNADAKGTEYDPPLIYNHGLVQYNPHVYAIFWGGNWNKEPYTAGRAELLQMYEELSGSTYQGVLERYGVASTFTVTAYTDTTDAPEAPSDVNDGTIRAEIRGALNRNPSWTVAPNDQFVVIPAPGTEYAYGFPGSETCAYHAAREGYIYDFVPGTPFARCAATTHSASHEYAEAATDPEPGEGWMTPKESEVADLCYLETGYLHPNKLLVNPLYDNEESKCSMEDTGFAPPTLAATTEGAPSLAKPDVTLHGLVNPGGKETHYYFEWGVTRECREHSERLYAGSGSEPVAVSQTVRFTEGVSAGTTIYYRIVAVGSAEPTGVEDHAYGENHSFEAPGPRVTLEPATDIASKKVTLNATINPEGAETTYYFEYASSEGTILGKVPASAVNLGSGTETVKVNQTLSGLEPGENYSFCVIAKSSTGATFCQTLKPFATIMPTATTEPPSNVISTEALLRGTVNPAGEDPYYHFEYGTTESYGQSTPKEAIGAGTSNVAVAHTIGRLTPGTKYYYRVVATSDEHVEGEYAIPSGADEPFTTTAVSNHKIRYCHKAGLEEGVFKEGKCKEAGGTAEYTSGTPGVSGPLLACLNVGSGKGAFGNRACTESGGLQRLGRKGSCLAGEAGWVEWLSGSKGQGRRCQHGNHLHRGEVRIAAQGRSGIVGRNDGIG